MQVAGGPTETGSKKQSLAASHTQESEHIGMSMVVDKCRSAINFFEECGFPLVKGVPLFQDNLSCCKLSTEHTNTSRSKHIPLRCHIVKEQVMKEKNFVVHWCPTDWQLADMFTKSLSVKKFEAMDLYIRGFNNRDFEAHCNKIEAGVWGSTLIDPAKNAPCSHIQINSFQRMKTAANTAEGECMNPMGAGKAHEAVHVGTTLHL